MRRTMILVLLAALPAAAAWPAERRAAAPPTEQLSAAAKRWKLDRAPERLAEPGPVGQADLFWEILELWQKDERARGDQDLEATVSWLLFGAGLARDSNLTDPVYGRVPRLCPALGSRLFDERLALWRTGLPPALPFGRGGEPWTWPEFGAMDRKLLARSARALLAGAKDSGPEVRVWLAALVDLSGEPGGAREFPGALAALAKELPEKCAAAERALAMSLALGRDPACLGLLLDLAERELAGRQAGKPAPPPHALDLFRALAVSLRYGPGAGALEPAEPAAFGAEIALAREWLAECSSRLVWDARGPGFVGALPPELAAFEKARRVYGLRLTPRILDHPKGKSEAVKAVVGLMGREPAAAADAELGKAVLSLVERMKDGERHEARQDLYVQTPKANRALGVELWRRLFRPNLLPGAQLGGYGLKSDLVWIWKKDITVVAEAQAALLPEMKKLYEDAAGRPASERLPRALAYIFAGGEVPMADVKKMLAEAAKTKSRETGGPHLMEWTEAIAKSGQRQGLWVMLTALEEDPALVTAENVGMLTGCSGLGQDLYRRKKRADYDNADPNGRLGLCRKWMDENGKDLVFAPQSSGFWLPPKTPAGHPQAPEVF